MLCAFVHLCAPCFLFSAFLTDLASRSYYVLQCIYLVWREIASYLLSFLLQLQILLKIGSKYSGFVPRRRVVLYHLSSLEETPGSDYFISLAFPTLLTSVLHSFIYFLFWDRFSACIPNWLIMLVTCIRLTWILGNAYLLALHQAYSQYLCGRIQEFVVFKKSYMDGSSLQRCLRIMGTANVLTMALVSFEWFYKRETGPQVVLGW